MCTCKNYCPEFFFLAVSALFGLVAVRYLLRVSLSDLIEEEEEEEDEDFDVFFDFDNLAGLDGVLRFVMINDSGGWRVEGLLINEF